VLAVDYLVIGHITQDLTPDGPAPGGTAAYAALTAQAMGVSAGIVTSYGPGARLGAVAGVPTACVPAETNTTFENESKPVGRRRQHVRGLARPLNFSAIPPSWRSARIVHLGPVAQEVDSELAGQFPRSLVCLTPQGWLRRWESGGLVLPGAWPGAEETLRRAGAAVFSLEDVQGDEETVEEYANTCPIVAVTEGSRGARVYWNTHLRRFSAPALAELDSTGAGDIFAATFFIRLHETRDPYEAGRFATLLASASVTRRGLEGVPTFSEIAAARIEVLL